MFAHDKSSEPDLHPYQILSKYLKGYKSYGAQKNVSTDGRMSGWSLYFLNLFGRGIKILNVVCYNV